MTVRPIIVTSLLALQLLSPSASGAAVDAMQPPVPRLSPEAQKVLAYLKSIQGEKMLAGHHDACSLTKDRDLDRLVETTGKFPALIEFHTGTFMPGNRKLDILIRKQLVQDAIAHWQAGGLVAICWTWGNLVGPTIPSPHRPKEHYIEIALTEGTPEHGAMLWKLDATAELLKRLRDAHVPVLWRPLHKVYDRPYWWSTSSPRNTERLWRFIHTYYMEHHQLDNLLWVYSFSPGVHTDWFPGPAYLDVVGIDTFTDSTQAWRANFDKLASIAGGPPVALSECDILPDPDAMKAQGFLWCWFSTWHCPWMCRHTPADLRRIYHHDLVVTRDELPDWKQPDREEKPK